MNALKNWSVLLSVIYTFVTFAQILCEDDCLYNKCEWKFTHSGYHEPCMGTNNRGLVRDVECNDGNTFHICCKLPYREDIQKSRQNWFRIVTRTGDKISKSCTKRILCEQSCKDGLNGPARSDYPQVLNGDTEADKEYVQAYKDGENQACYQQTSKEHSYDGKGCEADCQRKYLDCDEDIDKSYITKAYYESARVFHKLGLWVFSANWMIQDTFVEAKDKLINIGHAIKKGFSRLYDRMVSMDNAYNEWKTRNSRRKRSTDSTDEKLWKQFLTFYNKTDPLLVENVYESLNYNQFSNAVKSINDTLSTYDFGPGEWKDNGINEIVPCSTILFFFVTSILIFS